MFIPRLPVRTSPPWEELGEASWMFSPSSFYCSRRDAADGMPVMALVLIFVSPPLLKRERGFLMSYFHSSKRYILPSTHKKTFFIIIKTMKNVPSNVFTWHVNNVLTKSASYYLILSAALTKASSASIECLASHKRIKAISGKQAANPT